MTHIVAHGASSCNWTQVGRRGQGEGCYSAMTIIISLRVPQAVQIDQMNRAQPQGQDDARQRNDAAQVQDGHPPAEEPRSN